MIIALALERDLTIAQHFGHCPLFRLVTIEDGRQVASEDMQSPPHQPGLLPRLLHEKGASVVVGGGMGGSAQGLFQQYGIEPIVGVAGEADAVLEQFIKGELRSTDETCHEHAHHDECGH
jgi:predicted Fe-Mo cluster-binding NifX family protein